MKLNHSKQFAIAAAAVLGLTAASQAAIVFTDTFASGTGAWYKAGTANTLSNSSGQLSWSTSVGGTNDAVQHAIGRAFTSTTVAVGQTIRLTFDFSHNGTDIQIPILRVGFFDVTNAIAADGWSTSGTLIGAYTGYSAFLRDNSASANVARYESATDTNTALTGPTATAATDIGSSISQIDIANATTYQGVFDVTRTSPTQVNTLFTLSNGLSVSGTTTSVVNSFDTVLLRYGPHDVFGGTAVALFDNVQVSVIPEPSAALLGSLGLLALLRRRRN